MSIPATTRFIARTVIFPNNSFANENQKKTEIFLGLFVDMPRGFF